MREPRNLLRGGRVNMSKVLIVDDKQMMRDSVAATLTRAGLAAVAACNGREALAMIPRHRPAAIVTDLRMPEMDGLGLLAEVAKIDPQLPVILMTAYASVDTAVAALKRGAFDYIQKPFEGDELVAAVRRAVRHRELAAENEALRHSVAADESERVLIGSSDAMRRVRAQIERVAASEGTVMIGGESGTGKEIVAHAIHRAGVRGDRVMMCMNCAAMSTGVLESELFGHERGAFTSAEQMRKGRFELADGGTLLLDEISEVPPAVQAKLLRVLQERQFERVGSSVTMNTDVRIIATSNRDIEAEVAAGRFRQDLFYRLNVLPVHLPPLRERAEDVAELASHFLSRQAAREGRGEKRFDEEALRLLAAYRWPGNVRELENICQRAAVLARGPVIAAGTIQPWLMGGGAVGRPVMAAAGVSASQVDRRERSDDEQAASEPQIVGRTLEELEREVIIRTLGSFGGHRARTAKALGIGVRTLGLKLKKWKEQNLVASSL